MQQLPPHKGRRQTVSNSSLGMSEHTRQSELVVQIVVLLTLLHRPFKTAQPLVPADRPKPPSKLTVRGPFVYRDQILLLH